MSIPANEAKDIAAEPAGSCAAQRRRKPYSKPVLEPLGDIRDVTMGGSLGTNESGSKKGKIRRAV